MSISAVSSAKGAAPSGKQLLCMTLPQIGLMLCHLGIAMTDLWVAGRMDASVQAALGIVSQIFTLLMLLTTLVAGGSLPTISQCLGAGLYRRARRYAGLVLSLAASFGSLVAAGNILLMPVYLRRMGLAPDLEPVVKTFIVVYSLQLPFSLSLILANSIFRAYTLVWLPFLTLVVVAIANLAGSLGFGLGWWGWPRYGYVGVAWATFGSILLGLGCNLAAAVRRGILRRDSFAPRRWIVRAMPYLFRVAGPAALGNLAVQSGDLVMLALITGLPGDTVGILAGMTVGMRVESILLFPVSALGLTLSIFSGYLSGAGNPEALYRFGRKIAVWTAAGMGGTAALLYVCGRPVVRLLAEDEAVVEQAMLFLAFACAALPFFAAGRVLSGIFAGAGATRFSCVVHCVCVWGVSVPLGYVFARSLQWGASGVYAAQVAAGVLQTCWFIYIYTGKKWLDCGLRRR